MGNCLDRTISEDDEMPIRDDQHNNQNTNHNHESNLYLNNSNQNPPSYYQANRSGYNTNPLHQVVY
jgi:hypothetical protein